MARFILGLLVCGACAQAHDTHHGYLYEDSQTYLKGRSEAFRDRLRAQRWREMERRWEIERRAWERLLWQDWPGDGAHRRDSRGGSHYR